VFGWAETVFGAKRLGVGAMLAQNAAKIVANGLKMGF